MFSHLLDKNGLPSSRKLTRPGALDKLIGHTSWMGSDAYPAERLYCAVNNITEYPKKCSICENHVKFGAWGVGYKDTFCSRECQYQNMKLKPKKEKIKKPLLSEEEKQRRREKTSMERYGVPNYLMSEEYKEKRRKEEFETFGQKWLEMIKSHSTLQPQFNETDYNGNRHELPIKCLKCNVVFNISKFKYPTDGRTPCPTCHTPNTSRGQQELANWIRSLGILVKIDDRKEFAGKFELDLFIKSHNLVIEYDGLFWHSEKGRPDIKVKSKEKRDKCLEHNLRFISVFEDEWHNQQEIVKSRIKNALQIIDRKIFARKCVVKNLSNSDYETFMKKSHLQGYVTAKFKIGLFHDNELVAVMSFCKSRFNKDVDWELLRFATLPGTSVIGGASKLFSYWRSLYPSDSIVSFSDNRWGSGSFYEKLGFKKDGDTGQSFFYTQGNGLGRRSRQQMMKHKLVNLFENFDPNLSERDNCWNNKWYRVWDQGNTRWILK